MNLASPLQLGDHVEIVGPLYSDSVLDCTTCKKGQKTKITQCLPGGLYATDLGAWYPASSLRKVEELQIGDFVEVVGPSITGLTDTIGKRFMIEEIDDPSWPIGLHGYSCHGVMQSIWPASSLRKLAPDEIPQAEPSGVSKVVLDEVMNRLFAIEKHLNEIGESHAELIGDVEDVGKRLAFVEAFQKDSISSASPNEWEKVETPHCDILSDATGPMAGTSLRKTAPTLAAMIADGTLEVSDFRKKDLKTQRKIIRELEEDLANGCNGMTCAECMDEIESDGIRMAAMEEMKK